MFVHGLVKITENEKHGWKAPIELGEETPHYISFVVPLDDHNELQKEYTCEVVRKTPHERRRETHTLVRAGTDSFVLELPQNVKIWFHVRGVGKGERHLRYLGRLKHEDFSHRLSEIEPKDNAELDRVCEKYGTFIIGCDPSEHYKDINSTYPPS
jgi:hypothetical protein